MLWTAGVAALCLLVCLPLYMHYKQALRLPLAMGFKTMGTLCAMIMALIAAIKLDPRCYICAAALLFHAGADCVLELNLPVGAALFMVGHICYIAFFTQVFPLTAVSLLCTLGLLIFMALCLWRWRKQAGRQLPLFVVYGVVLCAMSGCALGALTGHTLQGVLVAIGGGLFYFSDAILLRGILFPQPRTYSWMILITYYLAQLLFGFSCLLQR